MNDLRTLKLDNLNAAVDQARLLLERGYVQQGEWSLGQICRHLVLVQDPSVDGYPWWMSLFAFLRPLMRWWLLPKIMSDNSPRGIRTASIFVPPTDLDDTAEVNAFAASVARFQAYKKGYAPHPAFGRLTPQRLEDLHRAHAQHHLRFLRPQQ